MAATASPTGTTSTGAIVASIAIVAASALLFIAIWLAISPQDNHYLALLTIGIVSLVFALVCYFGRAFTRAGSALQALSWGYAGFGFVLLIGSLLFGAPAIGAVFEFVGLFLVAILIGAVGVLAVWRRNSDRMTQAREAKRETWRAATPRSAFDYSTARPNVPAPTAPPSDGTPPAAPPGASQ